MICCDSSKAQNKADIEVSYNYRHFHRTGKEQNHQLVFERVSETERVIVAVNAADYAYTARHGDLNGKMTDLLTGEEFLLEGSLEMEAYRVMYLKGSNLQ